MAAMEICLSFRFTWLLGVKRTLVPLILALAVLLFTPSLAQAQLITNEVDEGWLFVRSLETLRDLNYQSWQVVAYRQGPIEEGVVLRIVGFPGKLRLEHPKPLQVHAGRRDWQLEDITMLNPVLASDSRQAAAEFDMEPLLADLSNNRPLRLELVGVFTELPVPPYLVGEWRSLLDE